MTKTGGKKICWTVPSVLHTTDKTLSSCSILQTFGRQGHEMVLGSIPTGCKTYSESCRAAAWDYLLILYKLSKYCRSCGCYLKLRIPCVFPPTHSYFRGNNGDKNRKTGGRKSVGLSLQYRVGNLLFGFLCESAVF